MTCRRVCAAFALALAFCLVISRAASAQLNGTCSASQCGSYNTADACWCDSACLTYGDCCKNVLQACWTPIVAGATPPLIATGGGTTLTITGAKFLPSAPVSTVTQVAVGGAPCNYTSRSDMSIVCAAPQGIGKGLDVSVTNSYSAPGLTPAVVTGTRAAAVAYAAPAISAVSPASAPTSGGATLTLTGTNFGFPGSAATVVIGTRACTNVAVASATLATCTIPAGEGVGLDVVLTAGGQPSNAARFDYLPPAVSSVSSPPTSGGPITITGSSFGLTPSVTLDTLPCPVATASHGEIVCGAPDGTGSRALRITVAGQTADATMTYQGPVLDTMAPATGSTAGNTLVTLGGTNFGASGAVVQFGASTPPVVSQTHTQIVFRTPAGQGLAVPVTVRVGTLVTNALAFDYDSPVISAVSAPPTGGGDIVITGSNFGTAPAVTFDGAPCPIVTPGQAAITCTAPAGDGPGHALVVSAGSRLSAPFAVAYQPPAIGTIDPGNGRTAGGTVLTITGSNFSTRNGAVSIGAGACAITSQQQTQIVCTTPAGQGLAQRVSVTVAGQPSTNTKTFDYDAPAADTVTSPPTSGGTIDIDGANFGLQASVAIDGTTPCPVTSQTHYRISCTVPPGQGAAHSLVVTVAGQVSPAKAFAYQPPSVDTIDPGHGPTLGGVTLTITGRNFGASGAQVTIGGAACPVASQSHTAITCQLPPGEGRNRPVVITLAGLVDASQTFTYDRPAIDAVTAPPAAGGEILITGSNFGLGASTSATFDGQPCPASGTATQTTFSCLAPAGTGTGHAVAITVAGQTSEPKTVAYRAPALASFTASNTSTAGGGTLTIEGSNFGSTGASVLIGPGPCAVATQTDTRITCVIPEGQDGDQRLTVTAGGQTSNPLLFSYALPIVEGATAAPSTGGPITITGANLGVTPVVTINGGACGIVTRSHVQIVCTAPAGAGGNNALQVRVGTRVASVSYAYKLPVLNALDGGAFTTSGGTPLGISGDNFGTSAAIAAVTVGEAACPVTSISHTAIVCTLPPGEGARVPVAVVIGGLPSNTLLLDYPGPSAVAVTPAALATQGGALTISGSNFGLHATVTIDGATDCRVTSQSHQQITCSAPAGVGSTHSLAVTVAGLPSPPLAFGYAAPAILALSTGGGPLTTNGGAVLTINGSNFGAAGATVTVGGAPCAVSGQSHTQLTCTLPPTPGGNVPVQVTVADQRSNVAALTYPAPAILSVLPQAIPTTGAAITITGSNFGDEGATVQFGGADCPVLQQSHTLIVCSAPAGQGAGVGIRVTAGGLSSNSASIDYLPPHIDSISPTGGPAEGHTVLTLAGSNFGTSQQVFVGSAPCPLVPPSSDTLLTCTVPVGTGTAPVKVITSGQPSNEVDYVYDAPVPRIAVAPLSMSFGEVHYAATYHAPLTIWNLSTLGPLTVYSLTVSGPNAGDFTFSAGQLPIVVPAGGSAEILVHFMAEVIGRRTATLTIVSNDPNKAAVDVALDGTTLAAELRVAPSTVAFSNPVLAGTTAVSTLTLSNTGTLPMPIVSATISGPGADRFAHDLALPLTLAPGEQKTVSVSYTPAGISHDTATLSIQASNGLSVTAQVPLDGTGMTSELTLDPVTIDFGGQLVGRRSSVRGLSMRNTGSTPITVTATLAGADAGEFFLANAGVPFVLEPGGSRVSDVWMLPTRVGAATAPVHVDVVGARTFSAEGTLSGVGVSTLVAGSPASIDFGVLSTPAASTARTVTLTNTGGDPLAFGTIVNSDPAHFTVVAPSPNIIYPGESRTVSVAFASTSAGSFTATVTIPMLNPGVPGVTLALSAQAVKRTIAVDPGQLKFDKTLVGATSAPLTVTVTNTSAVPLSLGSVTSDDAAFAVSDVDTSAMPPGGTATFAVVFHPSAEGHAAARIAVTIAGSATADAEVKATGMAEKPKKK